MLIPAVPVDINDLAVGGFNWGAAIPPGIAGCSKNYNSMTFIKNGGPRRI
jgi:hypothetical protein